MIAIARVALGVLLAWLVLVLLAERGTRGCGWLLFALVALVAWNVGC